MLNFKFIIDDEKLKKGLNILRGYCEFEETENGIPVIAEKSPQGISVRKQNGVITINYPDVAAFFYAFSLCLQSGDKEEFYFVREKKIKSLGLMRDCARNSALSVQGAKDLIANLALLGYDHFELYTEDLMKIDSLPYMGINRPAYTGEIIRELDAFAKSFGIELVPCIQTLSHLPQLFQHSEFFDINDIGPVLLVGEEKTYEFIETVVKWVAENFTSRKINIGFDEAHDMGCGRYAEKFGFPQN